MMFLFSLHRCFWRVSIVLTLAALASTRIAAATPQARPETRAAQQADAQQAESPPPTEAGENEQGQTLEAFEVSASRVQASDVETTEAIEHYDPTQIEDSGAFSVDEFFETLPPGDEEEEQLVLIDGVPAYIDPAMLALGMIEGIDVSLEGSMPEHGARADGRVINIRLKKEHTGAELAVRSSSSFAGGGARRDGKFSGGILRGKARLLFSLTHRDSEGLPATARSFSGNQDHTAEGGKDLRLTWGYPAVVAAADGAFDGAGGVAVLVPEGARDVPPPDGFVTADPAVAPGAEGQRRFDTAGYRWLSSPGTRTGGSLQFNYRITPRLGATLSASQTETRSQRQDAPPVSEASDDTIVPAAYNPFGEDVSVGLVHVGFGPTRQESESTRSQVGLSLDGRLADTWKWNGGVAQRRDVTSDIAIDLDDEKFAAALAHPDPAKRFNPFVDERVAAVNAHLYPELVAERRRRRESDDRRIDFGANGEVLPVWGGPARMSLRGRYNRREWERHTTTGGGRSTDVEEEKRSSYSGSASVSLPWVGAKNARTGIRRLETEFSGEYEEESDGGRERETELGAVWSPLPWLLLRVEYESEEETPPALVESRPDNLFGTTLIDPRRGFAVVSDVREIVRDVISVRPERSDEISFGATIEPTFVKGLRLKVDYDDGRRRDLFEDEFDPQEIIYNEASFPDRVTRAEPTPEDLAAGRPGTILSVDTTGGNAGNAWSRDVDFSVDYRVTGERLGQFRLVTHARHLLDAGYEIRPGVPFLNDGGSRFNPPDWRFRGTASWTVRAWTVSLRADHTGAITTGIIDDDLPAYTEFDLNIGYRWQRPLWGKFGRGFRVMASVDNLLDRDPPRADTLNGYRGGSPLGRSISISATLPL